MNLKHAHSIIKRYILSIMLSVMTSVACGHKHTTLWWQILISHACWLVRMEEVGPTFVANDNYDGQVNCRKDVWKLYYFMAQGLY